MTLNTAGIADGNYIVRAMSKANGNVWRKFASTDCLNMTVADGKVSLGSNRNCGAYVKLSRMEC